MLEQTTVVVAVAIATLVVPAVFLVVLGVGGWRRSRGRPLGTRFVNGLTLLAGMSLGTLFLMSGGLAVGWPLLAATAIISTMLLRRGRWHEAGWLLAGTALPWTVLWGIYVVALVSGANRFDPRATWLGFAIGWVPLVIGLVLALVQLRRPVARPGPSGPAGRTLSAVPTAIRAPAAIGIFGLSEIAAMIAFVLVWTISDLLTPASVPAIVRAVVSSAVAAALATEAWIRVMPGPARQAFEAFSWLGEWELARVREVTGRPVPRTQSAAQRWLLERPERPEERWIRTEILVMAGDPAQAFEVAGRITGDSPEGRFSRVASMDFADWFRGGNGDLAGLEAAAAEIQPSDSDARLRAEVEIATARVRRNVAAGVDPALASAPLREIRPRLGHRADGQVGRAMRRRLFPVFLACGVVFSLATVVLGLGPSPF